MAENTSINAAAFTAKGGKRDAVALPSDLFDGTINMRDLKYRKTRKKRAQTRHGINAERVKLHVSKGDTVRVMRGDDKGKEGKVLRIYPKTGRVLIEGINIVKKHRKARTADEQSGIIESPAPVHSSNVMVLAALDGLKQLTTVEEIARERGVEVSSLGYRSRAKVREAQLG